LKTTSVKPASIDDYISQAEAARIRGVSDQAIWDLVHRGKLTGYKIAGRTFVSRSEVEAFVAQPNLGRPPKQKVDPNTAKKKAASKKKGTSSKSA
jgi:excisionase family DNA binding protein